MYGVSDALVATVYTREYQDVALLIRQLSIVALLFVIEQSYSHVLVAQGRPRDKVAGQALSVVLFAVALLPAFAWGGVAGVIGLLAIAGALRILWMVYQLFGFRIVELRYDLLAVGGYYLLGPLLNAFVGAYASRWYQVGASVAEGLLAMVIALAAYRRLQQVCEVA
jgi:O-antigen/teichoic acid export membrane protein